MTTTLPNPMLALPTPEPCMAWCTNPKHLGTELVWDQFSRTEDQIDGEGMRVCTRDIGTVADHNGGTLATVRLQRDQWFDHVADPVTVESPKCNIQMGDELGYGMDFTRDQLGQAQQLLNAGYIMLAEPDLPLRHFGWCLFHDDGPDAEDCGPHRRDCTSEHHRIPAIRQRIFAGPDGIKDGGALNARLTNDPDWGPVVSLDDQIGSRDSKFPAWNLYIDDAEVLGHYLLALAGRARRGGGVR